MLLGVNEYARLRGFFEKNTRGRAWCQVYLGACRLIVKKEAREDEALIAVRKYIAIKLKFQ